MNSKTAAYVLGRRLAGRWTVEEEAVLQARHHGAVLEVAGLDRWLLVRAKERTSVLPGGLGFPDRDHAFACWLGTGRSADYVLLQQVDPAVLAEEIFADDALMEQVTGDIERIEGESGPDFLVLIPGGRGPSDS